LDLPHRTHVRSDRSAAKEYRGFGIRFNAVSPGLVIPQGSDAIGEGSVWSLCTGSDPSTVSADFGEREIRSIEAGIPLRRRSTAQDVAWSVVFLASAWARQLTGQVFSVSGGFGMPR
jgi:2-hydroxycyclohexanecarboxyl-CoA dehydrogenase